MNNIYPFSILIGLVLIFLINIISVLRTKKLYSSKIYYDSISKKNNNKVIFINCVFSVGTSVLIFIPIKFTFLLKNFMDIDVFDFLYTTCVQALVIILVILLINLYYSLMMFLKKD